MTTTPYVAGTSTETLASAEHWRRQVEAITENARTILRQVEEAQRIYRGNRLAAVIAGTAHDAAVPGTAMRKEQATAWAAMVDAVQTFMATEIAAGFTIQDGLYAMWPVPRASDQRS